MVLLLPRRGHVGMCEEVISKIVNSIADAEGVEPNELSLTLYDHIDTGVIEQLAKAEKGNWQLAFEIPKYTVTVHSDNTVLVEPKKVQQSNDQSWDAPSNLASTSSQS